MRICFVCQSGALEPKAILLAASAGDDRSPIIAGLTRRRTRKFQSPRQAGMGACLQSLWVDPSIGFTANSRIAGPDGALL